jgi:hypothetical protein
MIPLHTDERSTGSSARQPFLHVREPIAGRAVHALQWLTPKRFGIILALMIIAVFPHVIIGGQTFVFRDFSLFSYPNALYHRQCFWQGEIPLWNPLNNCGIPFLAQWNTMTLYPLSLIYLVLPMPWSLNVFCLLHLLLGAVGMFCLASHWTGNRLAGAVAGMSFGFCGLMLVSLIWPNIVAVLAWMPWVILTAERGWKEGAVKLWIAAFVACLQILAGMPEYTLLTWAIVIGLCLLQNKGWRAWGRLGIIAVVVSGLAAAQILPFFELLIASKRNVLFDPSEWSLPVWGWANFFVPLFHTRAVPQGVYFQAEQPLFTSYYVAIPVLLMALYATIFVRNPRVWFLAGLGIVGLWLATGKAGGLYKWLLDCSPVLGLMRYPAKFVALTVVALPLLAAFGIDHWTRRDCANTCAPCHAITILSVICGLIISGVMVYAHFYPMPEHDGPAVWWNGVWRIVFLTAATGALCFLKNSNCPKALIWSAMALLACTLVDSLTQVPKHYPTAPASVYAPGAVRARLREPPLPEQSRAMMGRVTHDFLYFGMLPNAFDDVIGRRVGLLGNLNLIENIATPDGFYAMYLPASRQVWSEIFFAHPRRFPTGLADFVAVSHITSPTNILEWTVRTNAMGLVSAGQEPRFVDDKSTLAGLLDGAFDPRKVVFLPLESRESIKVKRAAEVQLLSQHVRSHEVEVDAEAAEPALVVIAQSDYSPWRAFVDGTPTRIWRANYAFQAVEVPAGRHRVKLVYTDRAFQMGCTVSLLTLCGCTIGWRRSRKVRAESQPIFGTGEKL